MPTKYSLDELKSRRSWAGSIPFTRFDLRFAICASVETRAVLRRRSRRGKSTRVKQDLGAPGRDEDIGLQRVATLLRNSRVRSCCGLEKIRSGGPDSTTRPSSKNRIRSAM